MKKKILSSPKLQMDQVILVYIISVLENEHLSTQDTWSENYFMKLMVQAIAKRFSKILAKENLNFNLHDFAAQILVVTQTYEYLIENNEVLGQRNVADEEKSLKPQNRATLHHKWIKSEEFKAIAILERELVENQKYQPISQEFIQEAVPNGGRTRPFSQTQNPIFDETQCRMLFP